MIAHCLSVNIMRIKVTSHLVTLNHSATSFGILKRQQALVGPINFDFILVCSELPAAFRAGLAASQQSKSGIDV